MRIYTKTITPCFIKLATELTVRSNYKPQKVTTLRMSQAGVNIYRKLTIRFSLLLFEGGSWSSSSFRLACFEGQTQTPMSSYFSSRFKFKPEFISLAKSSSLKCIEHKDEVFPGVHIFLRSSIKSIHFFRLLSLCGHVVPKKGILCMLIPFASSLMFPHLAATHLSGIFEKRAEIPRLVFSEIQRKAEVTCS